jgi:hypothetical protein
MQRRGSSQWCRHHRGELLQGVGDDDVYDMPGASKREVRSMRQWGVCKPKRGSREVARLTATSTSAGDDLLEKLELSGDGFFSAKRR